MQQLVLPRPRPYTSDLHVGWSGSSRKLDTELTFSHFVLRSGPYFKIVGLRGSESSYRHRKGSGYDRAGSGDVCSFSACATIFFQDGIRASPAAPAVPAPLLRTGEGGSGRAHLYRKNRLRGGNRAYRRSVSHGSLALFQYLVAVNIGYRHFRGRYEVKVVFGQQGTSGLLYPAAGLCRRAEASLTI